MKKSVFLVGCVIFLTACVSEPIDPAFRGSAAIDKGEAAKTRVSLGLTYLKNGNFAQAKSNLDRALKFDPRSSDAHFAMAFYFQQVEEAELAEQYYERALSLSDNDPDIVNSYGVFLCQQGKYDKAKKYFLEAVNAKSYAATAETYENLAICTQSQGDIESAIKYFNSALNHQPTRAKTLFMLTNIYVEQGKWESAKKTLRRYERSAPVSAETFNLNYKIAKGMGDMKTALGYGELLMRSYPGHEYTKAYLTDIGKFRASTKTTTTQTAQTPSASQPAIAVQNPENEVSSNIETKPSDTPTKTIVRKASQTETVAQEVGTSGAPGTLIAEAETEVDEINDNNVIAGELVLDESNQEVQTANSEIESVSDTTQTSSQVAAIEVTSSDTSDAENNVIETTAVPETIEETLEDVEQLSDETAELAKTDANTDTELNVLEDSEVSDKELPEKESVTDNELITATASNTLEETVNSELDTEVSEADEAEQLNSMIDEFAGGVSDSSEDSESATMTEDVIATEDTFAEVSVPEASEEGLNLPNEIEVQEQETVVDEPVQVLVESEIEVTPEQSDIVVEDEAQIAEVSEELAATEQAVIEEDTANAVSEAEETLVNAAEDEVAEAIGQTTDINDTIPSEVETQDALDNLDETDQTLVASLSSTMDDGWHVVQRKENLYRISIKYNVTMAKLMEWNGIADASDIQWGTRLRVKEPSGNE